MISKLSFAVLSLFFAAALTSGLPVATAQDAAAIEAHPATKVVREYLNMILARKWDKSADIVDAESLKGLHKDYVDRVKHASTMDEEESMVRRVGVSTVEQVEQMKPRDFYTAYHEGLQDRYKVSEEALDIIRKTLTIKLLSLAQEDEKTVHILVRTKHSTGKVIIENLELISLLKHGEKWQVALNEQAPKATPLEGAGGDAAKPPAKPPVRPALDPVKPSPPKPRPSAKPSKPKAP